MACVRRQVGDCELPGVGAPGVIVLALEHYEVEPVLAALLVSQVTAVVPPLQPLIVTTLVLGNRDRCRRRCN